MRKLTLLRHGKSSWAVPGLNDFDRPLKKRGYVNTFTMAERYRTKRLGLPDHVLSSPSQRTMTTATLFCEAIGFPRENIKAINAIYDASTVELYEILSRTKNTHKHILLVAHNPGLSYLAIELCQLHTTNVPTSGVVHMECELDNWGQLQAGCGKLLDFDYPKLGKNNEATDMNNGR